MAFLLVLVYGGPPSLEKEEDLSAVFPLPACPNIKVPTSVLMLRSISNRAQATPRPLTAEEQAAVSQSVARQELWWSLAEPTARLDLEELEEWMGEQEEWTGGQEESPIAVDRRA
jgi:hypothetical protein